jgi:hypothetical protein
MLSALVDRARDLKPDRAQGKSLRVVPILGPNHRKPEYDVLRPGTLEKVRIAEVSEVGSVPTLRVRNEMEVALLLMDGQELIGAKQNRILNADVFVPAHSTLTIPVSCVEHGRWRAISAHFSPGKAASHRTRSAKLERVHDSLKRRKSFDADQSAVWDEVSETLRRSHATSPTNAMSDAYAKRESEMRQFRSSLKLPDRAVGVAMYHGMRFVGLDVFDRHATLQAFWESLVDSYAIELLDQLVDLALPIPRMGDNEELRSLLQHAAAAEWEPFDSPGEGKDWRLCDDQLSGAALLWEDSVVLHLQLYPRQRPPEFKPFHDEDFEFDPWLLLRQRRLTAR